MGLIICLIVIGSSVWVAVDASKLGVQRGSASGSVFDMGPISWCLCCLVLWIICFPAYLYIRPRYVAAARPGGHVGPAPLTNAIVPPQAMGHVPAGRDAASQLTELAHLRAVGAIDDAEFGRLKSRIVEGS